MIKETSAGIVVFKKNPMQFLLLHYEEGHWGFCKGHVEKGETLKQTALRETKEEANIDVNILDGFTHTLDYFYTWGGEKRHKTVHYFIGEATTDEVTLSHEHVGFKWLAYEDAMQQLTHENAKGLLKYAFIVISRQFE